MNIIFLFAHQDDEFGILHEIKKHANKATCFYFTTSGEKQQQRSGESIRVLSKLGIKETNIHFPGQGLNIPDLQLIDHIPKVISWLCGYLTENNIHAIYVPAWEGGHPDHDALNAATLIARKRINQEDIKIYQFSLYNAYRCRKPFFRVSYPLKKNGDVLIDIIPIKNRFKYLLCCLNYPSQWKTWVGLFPFVFFKYLCGKQQLQEVKSKKNITKPHAGQLYYEARNFSTWQKVKEVLIENLAKDEGL